MEILIHSHALSPTKHLRLRWKIAVCLFGLAKVSALEPAPDSVISLAAAAEPAKANPKLPLHEAAEYTAKAGFLLTMSRYVEWPAGTFARADAPLIIGVLGENPFGDVLERTAQGAKVQGRPVEIRSLKNEEDAAGCHVVFIAWLPENKIADWLRALRGKPVLTITESAQGLAEGAVLTFVIERESVGRKVNFHASIPNARTNGLRLDARMLEHAAFVQRELAENKATP